MKLSELMAGVTPVAEFTGWVTNDDYVLAVDTSGGAGAIADYAVVQMGIAGLDAQMNAMSQDKTYLRAGQSTQKTGTQKTFAITGDRYIGDTFQDYCFAHDVKYGVGNAVVAKYVHFCILNGKGEQGEGSIIVNSDGSGNAGESAGVSIDLKKIGAEPTEYTYSAI